MQSVRAMQKGLKNVAVRDSDDSGELCIATGALWVFGNVWGDGEVVNTKSWDEHPLVPWHLLWV